MNTFSPPGPKVSPTTHGERARTGNIMPRTSSGLIDVLFKTLEDARNGDVSSEDVKNIVSIADQILKVAEIEIKAAELKSSLPNETTVAIGFTEND